MAPAPDAPVADAPLLEVRALAVSAGGRPLVRGFSLALRRGERVALTGPSGSGKTTLLRALATLDDADAGSLTLRGSTPATLSYPAYRRAVLYVAQQPIMAAGTVEENLRLPWAYRGNQQPFPSDRAAAWMDALFVGADRFGQEARSLSIGQQQRVALIRALLLEPAVLLLDEPTSALDEAAASAVHELLRSESARRGVAALMTLHDRTQAQAWCDRTVSIAPASPPSEADA